MPQHLDVEWLIGDRIGVLNEANPVESSGILGQLEREGYVQIATVRPWPVTMAWRLPGSSLRHYMVRAALPSDLSQRKLFRFNEFCLYELAYGRRVLIWFEDAFARDIMIASITRFFEPGLADLDNFVKQAMSTQRERYTQLEPDAPRASACRSCHEGLCRTDLVCHTTSVESAIAILRSGKILSACRAYGLPAEQIAEDSRNAAGDPPDYFDYIMFGSGNCTAVDKLVLERQVGYVPSWEEFESIFQPGVRFYFRSKDLQAHPGFTIDGVHEKIHDELLLSPLLVLMVVPEGLDGSDELLQLARRQLPADKVVSFPFVGIHYKDWAQTVYREAKSRG